MIIFKTTVYSQPTVAICIDDSGTVNELSYIPELIIDNLEINYKTMCVNINGYDSSYCLGNENEIYSIPATIASEVYKNVTKQ